MIRGGKYRDIPQIIEMAQRFWSETIYAEPMDPDTVEVMAQTCIDQGMMVVVESGAVIVGFACGVIGGLLGDANVKVGTEVAWWVEPEHRSGRNGIGLLKLLEQQAKAQGIKYWSMAYMESSMPKEIAAIYEKMGYQRNEILYTKEL